MTGIRRSRGRRPPVWQFRLYISNHSPRSMMALANLKEMCESYLSHGYKVRIIDLRKEPDVAARDNILAVPTLKCVAPGPERTMVGSLSDVRVVSKWLALDALNPEEGSHSGRRVVSVQPVGRA